MRIINNEKLNKFKYFFENSEKGFVVAEINAIPILNEFLNSFSPNVKKIDVDKCKDYHSILADKNTPKNIILYNFEAKFFTPENISDEINLNRDIFYSYNKNIIFILNSSSIDELMQSNTSFWSCVFFHEFFCDYLPPLFIYKLINEVEVSYNHKLIEYSTIYSHIEQIVEHTTNNLKNINELLENPAIDDIEILLTILKTLYSYSKFHKIIDYSDKIFEVFLSANNVSETHWFYFYRVLLLRAAAYYNIEDYFGSKNTYQYIIDNIHSDSSLSIIVTNNLSCVKYKINSLGLSCEPYDTNDMKKTFADNLEKLYSCYKFNNEEVLSDEIKYNLLFNYSVCLLNNNEFHTAIEVIEEKKNCLSMNRHFKSYKIDLILNLISTYSYISIGEFSQAYSRLNRREYDTVIFRGYDNNVFIKFLSLLCKVYCSFSNGNCKEALFILKNYDL